MLCISYSLFFSFFFFFFFFDVIYWRKQLCYWCLCSWYVFEIFSRKGFLCWFFFRLSIKYETCIYKSITVKDFWKNTGVLYNTLLLRIAKKMRQNRWKPLVSFNFTQIFWEGKVLPIFLLKFSLKIGGILTDDS